jgi:sugar (pentulose or hexulose) kinase
LESRWDLLASGSSILWLAGVLGLSATELEELAVTSARSSTNEVLVFPYLAGGEQGALWRTDLTGSITGLNLSSGRVDLATSLFEAIAFETVRCLELLRDAERPQRIVSLGGSQSRLFGAALIGALSDQPVVAVRGQSPSLLGAALVALAGFGVIGASELDDHAVDAPPLNPDYAESLPAKLARYLAASPAPGFRA